MGLCRAGALSVAAVAVALAAGLAATISEAATGSGRYTLAPTKRCLATQHLVKNVVRTGNLALGKPPGGAVLVTLQGRNQVTLAFYGGATDARAVLSLVVRVRDRRGQSSPKSEFHTRRNVYVGWKHEPTAKASRGVEGCLR